MTLLLSLFLMMADPFPSGFEWFSFAWGDGNGGLLVAKLTTGDFVYRPGQLWPGRQN